jgi:hypothetical protein
MQTKGKEKKEKISRECPPLGSMIFLHLLNSGRWIFHGPIKCRFGQSGDFFLWSVIFLYPLLVLPKLTLSKETKVSNTWR